MAQPEDCELKPLHYAVKNRNFDSMESLLKTGTDTDTISIKGRTALNFVCYQAELSEINLKMIQLLIQHGADVNKQDEDGNSPMMNLFHKESNDMRVRIEALKILLKDGADVTRVNHEGLTIFSNIILCNPANPDTAVALELLLKNGSDPNMIVDDEYGTTALNFICYLPKLTRVHLKMIQILLKYKADVNIQDKDGCTPIINLFRFPEHYKLRLEVFKLLLENQADVTLPHGGFTILYFICHCNAANNPIILDAVELLFKIGIDVNVKDNYGHTALHVAVEDCRDIRVIELLLKNGADPNIIDNRRNTPLHLICSQHKLTRFHLEMIQLLLQYEADVNIRDDDGFSPIMNLFRYAKDYKLRLKVCKLLLVHGADVTLVNCNGNTILHLIFQYNAEKNTIIFEAVELLLKSGVDVNKQNKNGYSALHVAVNFCEHVKIIVLLLKNGADPNALDKDGSTALSYICAKQNSVNGKMTRTTLKEVHLKMIKLLIQYKADLNVKTHQNISPIMHLFENQFSQGNEYILRMKMFGLLVKNGADLKNVDVFRKSMLLRRILCCNSRGDLPKQVVQGLEFLLKNGADVNIKDNDGKTVLHQAVHYTQTKHVAFLLKNGADPNITDVNGNIPLNYIFEHLKKYYYHVGLENFFKLLKLNVEHNADPCHVGGDGKTVLHSLIQKIRRLTSTNTHSDCEYVSKYAPQYVEILLKHGLDINVKDRDGFTALNKAVSYCNYDIAKILVERGADANTVQFKDGFLEKRWIESSDLPNFLAIIKLWQSKGFQINNHQYLAVFKFLTLHQDFETNDDFHSWLFELCNSSYDRLALWIRRHICELGSGSLIRKSIEMLIRNDSSTCTNFDSAKIKKTLYTEINLYLYVIEYGNMYFDIETYNYLRNKLNSLVCENPEIDEHYRECSDERRIDVPYRVDSAKKRIISNNISFMDLCTSSPDKTYYLLTKCDFESAINLADIYCNRTTGGIIRGYIVKALVRRFITQSTTDYIKLLFYGILPDLCCDKIVEFLDVVDLVSVFEAFINCES